MKKFIIGVVLGIIVLVVFLYLGGAKYVKIFGSKTEEAGAKLEKYEKRMKETAKDAGKAIEKTAEGAKEVMDDTVDTTKDGIKKAKEYVGK